MKNIILCTSLALFSCKENTTSQKIDATNNKTEKRIAMDNKFPYTSDNIKKFYKTDSDSINYTLNINNQKLINFSTEEISLPIKENDFEISPKASDEYAVLETFDFPYDISCKLIIYNTFGENNSKVLNVQLESYKQNKLIDQILIDCRFSFENQYFRTFSINKDGAIELVKNSIISLEYNEDGDIIGEKQNADVEKQKIIYQINHEGKFIKNP